MYWDVTKVEVKKHLTLKVEFKDGLTGYVCFIPSHLTGVFEKLNEERLFNNVDVDHGVVTWPGELDLPPDAMHAEIKKHGRWVLS